MNKFYSVLAIILCCITSQTQAAVSKCNDKRVIQTLKNRINGEMKLGTGMSTDEFMSKGFEHYGITNKQYKFLNIHRIQTLRQDPSQGYYSCSANFLRIPAEFTQDVAKKASRPLSQAEIQAIQNSFNNSSGKKKVIYEIYFNGKNNFDLRYVIQR